MVGEAGTDTSTLSRLAVQCELAAEHRHAFLHAKEAKCAACLRGVKTTAIVGNADMNGFTVFLEVDPDLVGLCVTGDIGQGFLNQPEEGDGQIVLEAEFFPIHAEVAGDVTAGLKFIDVVLDCRGQAQGVQHAGAQAFGNAAYGIDGVFDLRIGSPRAFL